MKRWSPRRFALAALLAVAGSACNGTGSQQAAAGTTGSLGTGGGGSDDVTGTMINRYFMETGAIDRPADLSAMTIKAYIQQGGSWVTRSGTGKADGTFTVPGVPQGLYMLEVSGPPPAMCYATTSYVYTAARALDLGTEYGGRPDAGPLNKCDPPQPMIQATLQNLSPWQQGDLINLLSPNVAGIAGPVQNPTPGATTFSGNFQWLGALVDASKGNVVYAAQYTQQSGAIPYRALSRFASFAGVEQALEGTSIDGSLAAAPVATMTMDYRGSEFVTLGSATNPGAQFRSAYCFISTGPGMATAGMLIAPPSLLGIATSDGLLGATLGETDVLATMSYGNPFPKAWGIGVNVEADWWNASEGVLTAIGVTTSLAEASSGPIRPLIAPVQSPAVNGKDAFGSLSSIGLSPTLSWKPPAKGTPRAYVVSVVETTLGATEYLPLSIVTTETSLPLPPGLLESGHSYNFLIRAVASPIDASTAPFRRSVSYAYADIATGTVTP